jgi:hypothetical protein
MRVRLRRREAGSMPARTRPLDLRTLRAATVGPTGAITPLEALAAGTLSWPWEHAHRVLHEWRLWAEETPGLVRGAARILRMPGRAPCVAIDLAVVGDPLAPLRRLAPSADTVRSGPPVAIAPVTPVAPSLAPISSGARLRSLPPAAVDALVRAVGPESRSELVVVELARAGGAWTVAATGPGRDPEQAERVRIALERLDRALAAWR